MVRKQEGTLEKLLKEAAENKKESEAQKEAAKALVALKNEGGAKDVVYWIRSTLDIFCRSC